MVSPHALSAPSRARASGLELADVVRAHGPALRARRALSPEQRAALHAIEQCRTAALGGHLDHCTDCGHEHPSYNSCRNRHCPKCQSFAQARWIDKRLERLLPVHYFHVVFTLPSELRVLAMRHREAVFNLLFTSAAETLLLLGKDRLGAELGITMVLHTWTRELLFHPHVHAIVTGGGLSLDGTTWISTRTNFLFHVRRMGALFRGKMMAALERSALPLDTVDMLSLRKKNWIVYAKKPFGSPEHVIRYLGQYTHRVGISNQRLVSMNDSGVTFRTKDGKQVTVDGVAFLERFVQHVLPSGFVKIRHYGLHSSSHATTRLQRAQRRCYHL
jgi:Putative transposase/Transposase zinc-binding domain